MSADRRLCRKSSRKGVSPDQNYHSHDAYKKAKRKAKLQRAGRKAARRQRRAR